jgi:hypothetical protein
MSILLAIGGSVRYEGDIVFLFGLFHYESILLG